MRFSDPLGIALSASACVLIMTNQSPPLQNDNASRAETAPVVIAHRGASGYLPEHTAAAMAMAHGMNADYIEQDVVLTRDAVPIVLHDIHLDTVTDVAMRYPDRAREDGRFYAIDFDLAEIKLLRVRERFNPETGKTIFPRRFPSQPAGMTIMTLREALQLIQGMNRSRHREAGIYPEIKAPHWHKQQGQDITPIVIAELAEFGYRTSKDKCFLQCFDRGELQRIRQELGCELRLIQLMGRREWEKSKENQDPRDLESYLDEIKGFANGVGPPLEDVLQTDREGRFVGGTALVEGGQATRPIDSSLHGSTRRPAPLR